MNKYLLLAGTSLLSLSMAYAGEMGVPVYQGGAYVGVNLGMNSVSVDKSLNYPIGGFTPSVADYHSAYNSFHGQLTAGMIFPVANQFNIAVEGDADLFTGTASYTVKNWFLTQGSRAEERLNYGFGVFVLPEIRYNPYFRIFAGPGFNYSQFQVKAINTGGQNGVSRNFDEWLAGWSIKAGVANAITPTTDLLVTYQYSQYGSESRTAIEPLSGDALTARYRPDVNIFMIGLRHMFW